MRVAQVILDIPTKALDSAYTYRMPDNDEAGDFPVRVGCAVLVPFGSRQAIGYVVAVEEVQEEFAEPDALFVLGDEPAKSKVAGLKQIIRALSTPYFTRLGAECAQFMAHRYVAPLASCVHLFTPPGAVPRMVHTNGYWQVQAPQVGEVDDRWVVPGPALDTFTPRANAVKQQAVMAALRQGEVRVAELTAEYGAITSVLNTLEKAGVLVIEHRRRMRGGIQPAPDQAFSPSRKPQLTASQEAAIQAIRARQQAGGGAVLVDGVTGSGKTEVYLHAIEEVLAQGKTACVLVPEISLTPQTVARFRGRFGRVVAVLHSKMSAGERYDQWDFIKSGEARVVVGARSALFAPLQNLGLIVIDEEHESSYKQDQAPRYVARDVAEWLARQAGCTLVLGSATPSLEALQRVQDDPTWDVVQLHERANGQPMPPITIIDRSAEFRSGSRSAVFSLPLSKALEEELDAGRKCVLMLNQRGFAKFLLCRDCGYIPSCTQCSTSYTFHQRGAHGPHLTCHHCGITTGVPATCPECGSPNVRMFGAGTQRVEDELKALIAGFQGPANLARVVRMDADTTQTKGAHQKLLEEFAQPGAAVLLGTQMIAKGLDFNDVTLVGVISADTMLGLPDFRSAERTFDLIEQVAGRAGRGSYAGRVLVQTYRPQDAAIRAAAAYDRQLFLDDELPRRQMLGFPPYVRLVNVLVTGESYEEVKETATKLEETLHDAFTKALGEESGFGQPFVWSLTCAGPCVLEKLRNAYRWHVVVKTGLDVDVSAILEGLFRKRKPNPDVTVSLDVDAFDLL